MLRGLPTRPGCLILHALRGAAAGLAVALALHFGYVFLGSNFRTVIPGVVYRCGQPSPQRLERFVRRHGIRTVVNLRGCCLALSWYRAECEATARLDVAQEDVSFSACRLPSAVSIRQLIEVLERSEYPILFHCHQGADRTGLASAMFLLLRTDTPLREALRQLGPASGHIPLGRTAHIDSFFSLYRQWLAESARGHSPAAFRLWASRHYCPDGGRATFELIEPAGPALRACPEQPCKVTVRCHNTSRVAWSFHPGRTAGVHGSWTLFDRDDRHVASGRTGLRHATVRPGGSIDLGLALPPLPPGTYELHFDLIDEQHGGFMQLGNDMLSVVIEVS